MFLWMRLQTSYSLSSLTACINSPCECREVYVCICTFLHAFPRLSLAICLCSIVVLPRLFSIRAIAPHEPACKLLAMVLKHPGQKRGPFTPQNLLMIPLLGNLCPLLHYLLPANCARVPPANAAPWNLESPGPHPPLVSPSLGTTKPTILSGLPCLARLFGRCSLCAALLPIYEQAARTTIPSSAASLACLRLPSWLEGCYCCC